MDFALSYMRVRRISPKNMRCQIFFLIRLVGGGVQLGPLGTAATDWPTVACPGWLWWWRTWWDEDWQGKPKYSDKTCPSATLSTTNPTWPDPGSNPVRHDGKPATSRLSYGTPFWCLVLVVSFNKRKKNSLRFNPFTFEETNGAMSLRIC
jgi:hypothetical protein